MKEYWYDHWFFILEEKIAPLLIGNWGGFMDGGQNQKWMELIRDLMIENHIHHTFWCFNENSVDTGGVVKGGWTQWDEDKYALIKPALWQNANGKFISLDHKIPVGKNADNNVNGPNISESRSNNSGENWISANNYSS